MTGPEHYREAERRIALAAESLEGSTYEARHLRYAKAHAVLAFTAATVAAAGPADTKVMRAWLEATS